MKELSSKDYEEINKIFSDLSNLDKEEYQKTIKKFKSHLRKNNIECVIANVNKIVFAYGKKVKNSLNCVPSKMFLEYLNDEHLATVRTSCLKITENITVKRTYYYEQLKMMENYASIVFFFTDSSNEVVHEILDNLKWS